MSEKERNDIYQKIATGLQKSTETMLRIKKDRKENVCYAKSNGKTYTITARTALKRFLSQDQTNR